MAVSAGAESARSLNFIEGCASHCRVAVHQVREGRGGGWFRYILKIYPKKRRFCVSKILSRSGHLCFRFVLRRAEDRKKVRRCS